MAAPSKRIRPTFTMPSMSSVLPALLLVFPAAISAASLDCKHIQADGQGFNLGPLGGPKDVHWVRPDGDFQLNTTFTVDLCNTLKPDGQPKNHVCQAGTRVCGVEREQVDSSNEWKVRHPIEIAGEYSTSSGNHLDPKFTRMKNNPTNSNAEREGLWMELHGGYFDSRKQKAIIEFVCDRNVKGTEGFEAPEDNARKRDGEADEGGDGGKAPALDEGHALQFTSYKPEDGQGVLRMSWRTKYACEDAVDEEPAEGSKKRGWGFFTWFLIVTFLLAAAYIILGSWLNYNRYGARGWDLVPHGDTIRDLPYIVKDLGANVMDKLRGSGSRGGYSAV